MSDLAAANRTYHVAQGSMALLPNYYRWTYGRFLPYVRGTVIELGSGSGLGIPAYVERADRIIAVDHDRECLDRIRARWPGDRVTALDVDLLGDWHELGEARADAIFMMDVVEHFGDDRRLIAKAAEFLKPGGVLAIKVPAHRALFSTMDEASGHYRRYDRDDMSALARDAGLEIVELFSLNRVGGAAYRLRGNRHKSNFSRSFKPWQLRAINTALPLIKLGDTLPGLPALSYGMVLRRPA